MNKLKIHQLKLDKKEDTYNKNRMKNIHEFKRKYEEEMDKNNFRRWLSTQYQDQHGINDYHYKIINNFIKDTNQLLKKNNINLNENQYKDCLASYIYTHNKEYG